MQPSSVLAHVGSNLRQARQHAGLSQAALAERSGISRRTIVNVEAGEANISLTGVDRLAEALGTSFTALVSAPGGSATSIGEVAWRGADPASVAVLLASVPSREESQLWTWTLGPGERYDAQPDPDGWHEMLLVTDGTLLLARDGEEDLTLTTGQHVAFSTAREYAYVNAEAERPVAFVRVVVR
ncbi:helix-turn-helix domain-containing protein [Rathayibacter sp. SD072]|uniref:helix-turn-helix domain-containing protein n=1 Tax=Rathayibacter sp. SD072 TaxID=2781731 RepID=UPI001A969149|nr:helix-turn-helix transcriptional regulator [Rathayibacter sp. SD072]MBO0983787.1 helix-turn-helix domain-containing protein [Rathayibacter sp. SD072]